MFRTLIPVVLLLCAGCECGPPPIPAPADGGGNGTAGNGGAAGGNGGTAGNNASGVRIVDPGSSVQPGTSCVCSRQDAVPNGMCPKGVNQTASAMIGPMGGSISLMGQQGVASGVGFQITFPPTAVAQETLITVTETSLPPPAGLEVDYSPLYKLEPLELTLAAPAQVKVPFSNGRGGFSFDQNLSLFWSGAQTDELRRVPSGYANAGFMQANVGRLGYGIVGYVHAGSSPPCQ